MKIKEIDRTANVAWSPSQQYPIYLAAGTAAQQLDSSFSTNSSLELYCFDVTSPSLDVPVSAGVPCESRFHKLVWGCHGMGTQSKELVSGVIIGGFDGGLMNVYDAGKILKNEDPLVLTKNKHTGAVRALDFNSFRPYLIASGATDSEIFIWDLNNPKTPMSPGARAQPHEDVTCLAWNKQVEHILASTFSSRCVVWDLRKNEPIIKLADTGTRIRYKVVEWHPATATQMCLASEDDANPVIQLWDLRYATSPLKVLQGHEKGVLSLSWCQRDSDLLLSCGKDNHIYCWNPNIPFAGYELVCDIHTSSQWSFDVSFCPRNPLAISTSSFDGRICIYSLSGGSQQPVSSSKLADSFPGMSMDLSHAPVPTQKPAPVNLRDPPKWLKRPCGASFAFGGKLITFSNLKQDLAQGQGSSDSNASTYKRIVTISQVVTLPEFVARSQRFESAIQNGTLAEFCEEKSYMAKNADESKIWQFLQASFDKNSTEAYLGMLGFNSDHLQQKLASTVDKFSSESVDSLTDGFVSLGRGMTSNNQLFPSDAGTVFDNLSQPSTRSVTPEPGKLFPIPTDESIEGLLNQALLSGNIEYAVDICLKDSKWADAMILASMGGPELIKKAQLKYFHKCENESSNMIRAVVTRDLRRLVERCDLEYWAQALATVLNYANDSELVVLADTLGRRLESSRNETLRKNALLCYICCGDVNRLMDGWVSDCDKASSPDNLQDVIEQVTLLRKAAEMRGKGFSATSKHLVSKLAQYATLLASQGCLESALSYVSDASEPPMLMLKETLLYSLGLTRPSKSVFQPRSRQASESSTAGRHSTLTKRPSYPSVPQTVPAPAPFASFERKMSAQLEPNISALTGPVMPPTPSYSYNTSNYFAPEVQQPMAKPPVAPPPSTTSLYNPAQSITKPGVAAPPSTSSVYNPVNVNVNSPPWGLSGSQPSPYSSQSSVQPQPAPSQMSPVRAPAIYNPNEVAKEMKNSAADFGHLNRTNLSGTATPTSATSAPLLPASIAPPKSAWNDPPMLKDTNIVTRPKKPATPRGNPITHPIFGSASQQPEQQQLYQYPPQQNFHQHQPNMQPPTPAQQFHPPPSTQQYPPPPARFPPTNQMPPQQLPLQNQVPTQYPSAVQPAGGYGYGYNYNNMTR